MKRIEPGPGQESVWDYPRPPRVEACTREIRVVLSGETIARTRRAMRVLETSHPPVYYVPSDDVRSGVLQPAGRETFCEWKGVARYFDVHIKDTVRQHAAWGYDTPTPVFKAITDHVAFYPHLMDACYVDDERVQAQLGGFYGGWITREIVGPYKGQPGTLGW